MQPHSSAPDIYLMKREKSRTGCILVVIVLLAVLVLGCLFTAYRYFNSRRDGVETAEPVEMPDAMVEADVPPVVADESVYPLPPEVPPVDPAAPVKEDATPPPPPPPPPPQPQPVPQPEPARAPSGEDFAALFAQARERLAAGDFQGARETGLRALDAAPGNQEVERFLSDLAMPLLASTRPMPEKVDYVVQSGDFLGKLAATFNTPVALIAKANNIHGATIRVNQPLKLLDGNKHIFAVTISKSRNDLLLTLDGKFFKRYRVSTGTESGTPVGVFKIIDKIAQPAWHKPGEKAIPYGDPENLLGTHWLALDLPGYGLHGTWEPETLGQQSSAGCVRLLNDEIEELYSILPKGTVVTIVE